MSSAETSRANGHRRLHGTDLTIQRFNVSTLLIAWPREGQISSDCFMKPLSLSLSPLLRRGERGSTIGRGGSIIKMRFLLHPKLLTRFITEQLI